jgi:hypothetical protein
MVIWLAFLFAVADFPWPPSQCVVPTTAGMCNKTHLTVCQDTLDDQLPSILQQLQDSGHGTTAFHLAREICNADKREAEAQRALRKAREGVRGAKMELQKQLGADLQSSAHDLIRHLRPERHHSYTDSD